MNPIVALTAVVAARSADDPAADGAWFQFDVTQTGDQQHSPSALLGAAAIDR